MFEWNRIQSKTEMEYVLNVILEQIRCKKISNIFTLDNDFASKNKEGIIGVEIDNALYIRFENEKVLIIGLTDLNNGYLEYRKLNNNELDIYNSMKNKDLFNGHYEIHDFVRDNDGNLKEISKEPYLIYDLSLEYDEVEKFEVIGFNHSYEQWISNGNSCTIIEIPAGGDYFDEIDLVLKNGTKICLRAQDAIMDGYADVWVENNSK